MQARFELDSSSNWQILYVIWDHFKQSSWPSCGFAPLAFTLDPIVTQLRVGLAQFADLTNNHPPLEEVGEEKQREIEKKRKKNREREKDKDLFSLR